MANIEKLVKVLEDEQVVAAINACTTKEEILAVLKEKGVEVTEEELKNIIKNIKNNASEKLDLEAMDQIAGGGSWLWDVDSWLRKHSDIYKRLAEEWDEELYNDDDE